VASTVGVEVVEHDAGQASFAATPGLGAGVTGDHPLVAIGVADGGAADLG
jgi:hypothetical protein